MKETSPRKLRMKTFGIHIGNEHEAIVKQANDWYKRHNLAVITKQEVPTTGRVDNRRISGRSTVDFEGIITGGKHIAFDCKSTISDHLPMGAIEEHQVDHLIQVRRLGGYAFLLVWFRNSDRMFIIDVNPEWVTCVYSARIGLNLTTILDWGTEIEHWQRSHPRCDYLKPYLPVFDPGF